MNERTRNNVRMGVFVTVALILALGVTAALTGAWERLTVSTREYTVTYPVSVGVGNLKKSSDVRVGGMRLGEVVEVTPNYTPVLDHITVRFKIASRVELFDGAVILVTSSLLGADSWLDIVNVGSREAGPPADPIAGTAGFGLLNALLGGETASKTGEIVDGVKGFVDKMDGFGDFIATVPDEYRTRIVPIIDDVHATTTRVRSTVESFTDDDWPRWVQGISDVIDWANEFKFSLDAALADGHGLLTDGRELVAENRANVLTITDRGAETMERAARIAATIEDETIPKVNAFLDTGNEGLQKVTAILDRFMLEYERWATDLGESLANANLASHQLKLAMIEIRRSPWRILYRPSTRELEHEFLYEAARTFAMAASDLKAASISVERVLDQHGEMIRSDEEAFERLKKSVLDPLDRYTEAQERLLEILFQERVR